MCVPAMALDATGEQTYRASGVYTVELRSPSAEDRTQTTVPGCVICHLGSPETLTLSFDMMGGNVKSLYYSFVHYNADWQRSDLMEMEFVDGFNKIYDEDDAEQSFNTTVPYVHYTLSVSTAILKASGNYAIEVRDAMDEALVLREPLWVTEDLCGIATRVDKREATQEVEVAVRWPSHGIAAPETELSVMVWQNRRTDDIRVAGLPTFIRPDELTYQHQEGFSFCGGTEWRWMDTRSIRLMGISSTHVDYLSTMYHYTMAPDQASRTYSYHEDFNGGSWIETRDRRDGEAEVVADYGIAHYSFMPDDVSMLDRCDVYIIGDATGWEPSAGNRLEPDHETMTFVGQHVVKQGLHNYLYAARPRGRKGHDSAPQMTETEGCHGETENDYYIAVYARRPGQTYDHLVAIKRHNTLKTRNEFIM